MKAFLSLVCIFSLPGSAETTKESLSPKMQELHRHLENLLDHSVNDRTYSDPSNRKEIETALKSMMGLSHRLTGEMIKKDPDPAISGIPEILSDQILESYLAFREKNYRASRRTFRTAAHTCISCHLKTDDPYRFKDYFFFPNRTLNDFERAQYLSASRQYKEAFHHYLSAIRDPKTEIQDMEEAISEALIISIRSNGSPQQALQLTQLLITEAHIPVYLKMLALKWKNSLWEWNTFKKIPETETGLFKEAKKRIRKGMSRVKYLHDRSGEIEFIRASALLDQLIRRFGKSPYLTESFYLQGICLDSMTFHPVNPLSNLYYESCIRKSPHTELAEQCYRKIEENYYRMHSTENGIQLPEELKSKLIELWSLSMKKSRLQSGVGK